jgi:septal ring factor EnvC (AmiA/AmiB activator)
LSAIVPFAAVAQQDEEQALQQIRERIARVETRLARETERRADQASQLKRSELAVAAATTELANLRARGAEQSQRQRGLSEQTRAATDQLGAERDALAQQVRLSYMTGREELFKLLLSQESPASLGRMIVYYDYLNRARSARIGAVTGQIRRLATLAEQSAQAASELQRLQAAQETEVAALETARGQRRAVLTELDRSIAAAGNEIEGLRQEEQRLADLLVELGELLAAFPVSSEEPFAALKGRLPWPAPGELTNEYGTLRSGGPIRWNGVMLQAGRGTPVRSVYHGRVAFSDWLPGLGLLIIVDHGEGYMSLYGHNEVLLKEPGDWVEPGETIAQMGDSGGQAAPSLYFEIRHRGDPENPHQWIAGSPAQDK